MPARSSSGSGSAGHDPEPGTSVVETHISTVFLIGDRAYKLKKPVKTGFLDFSDEASRLQACVSEVEVNRRFSPDVYLGVCDVIGPDGRACDHLVAMKRMPLDRCLATLIGRGEVGVEHIEKLARHVAGMHASSDRSIDVARDATRDAIARRWRQNLEQMAPFAGRYFGADDLRLVEELCERFLVGRQDLFRERIDSQRIVDGHGDLKADDIYLLDDGPRILDAIEFDPRLRHLDVIDDAALLVMDLERRGAHHLGRAFLDEFLRSTNDAPPDSLIDHYIAYRAMVRAKVAAIRAEQGSPKAEAEARQLIRIAIEHLLAARVTLILVGGLPGSGKSTLAAGLAEACGYEVLDSDLVRKGLAGLRPADPAVAGYRQGIYSPAFTARTYEAMLAEARRKLALGVSVVISASWTDGALRRKAREMAAAASADLVGFRVAVPRGIARERLAEREMGAHPSDATAAILELMARDEVPWPEALTIDADRPVEGSIEQMLMAMTPVDAYSQLVVSRPPRHELTMGSTHPGPRHGAVRS